MKYLFLHYPKCGTCIKAAKWLRANGIDVEARDITLQNPTAQELSAWIPASGLPIRKFFNTSGLKYRELNLKEKMETATREELLSVLASDGKAWSNARCWSPQTSCWSASTKPHGGNGWRYAKTFRLIS